MTFSIKRVPEEKNETLGSEHPKEGRTLAVLGRKKNIYETLESFPEPSEKGKTILEAHY